MKMSCASRMEVKEEMMGGGMSGEAVSSFRAVGALERIWAEVSPF